jgi:hypothetical protein
LSSLVILSTNSRERHSILPISSTMSSHSTNQGSLADPRKAGDEKVGFMAGMLQNVLEIWHLSFLFVPPLTLAESHSSHHV